ncbi:MAG: (d)CMP kinase [Candidatus Omnitrophica bacterium]|nr:(d)CMP kinase [Candidatus Omnitrophota bacterium]
MIIAIDGPAGSGKSTISKKVAKRLGFTYLDTGAMYRAATLRVAQAEIDMNNEDAIVACVREADIKLLLSLAGQQKVMLDGNDVTDAIRAPEITRLVKHVAKLPSVRAHLVALQKGFSQRNNIVAEGRDTTTVVFPDAYLKIYLDGDQHERARRRFIELQEKGIAVTFDEVLNDQKERDKSDVERKVGPLRKARDAVVVDTTEMTIEQVSKRIVFLFKKRWRDNHNYVYTFFKPIFMVIFKLLFRITFSGQDNVPQQQGMIVASNHASVIDPICLGLASPRQLSYMAKRDLFKVRFLGWLISLINVYPINREIADTHALSGGLKMVDEQKAVVIFPEGTRTTDGTVKPARKYGVGFIALTTGCVVVPAYINGSHHVWPKGAKKLRCSKVSVVFGKPVTFEDINADGKDRYRLATAKVMQAIMALERHVNDGR